MAKKVDKPFLIRERGGEPVTLSMTVYEGSSDSSQKFPVAGQVVSFGRTVARPAELWHALGEGGVLGRQFPFLLDADESVHFPLGVNAGIEDEYTSLLALVVFFDPARGWTAVTLGMSVKEYQLWGYIPVRMEPGIPLLLPERIAVRIPSGYSRDHVIVMEQDRDVCTEQTAALQEANITSGTWLDGQPALLEDAALDDDFALSQDDLRLISIIWAQHLRWDPPLPSPRVAELGGKLHQAVFGPRDPLNRRIRLLLQQAADRELINLDKGALAPLRQSDFLTKVAMRHGLTFDAVKEHMASLNKAQQDFLASEARLGRFYDNSGPGR